MDATDAVAAICSLPLLLKDICIMFGFVPFIHGHTVLVALGCVCVCVWACLFVRKISRHVVYTPSSVLWWFFSSQLHVIYSEKKYLCVRIWFGCQAAVLCHIHTALMEALVSCRCERLCTKTHFVVGNIFPHCICHCVRPSTYYFLCPRIRIRVESG